MFKDYDKYLSTSLKVYLFVLFFVFILKLAGADYFHLDLNNPAILKIGNYIISHKLDYVWYFITIYFNTYIMLSICLKKYGKTTLLYSFPVSIINYINGYTIKNYVNIILFSFILDFIVLFLAILIFDRKNIKKNTKKLVIMTICTIVYQLISSITRNNSIVIDYNNIVINILLNLDYFIMLIITYICVKGGVNLCGVVEVYSYSLKKMNLKNLLQQFQRNLHNFKQKSKQERLAISIYIALSLLWNTISLIIILFVANLNHTFVECVFILTSFWLSKHTFGKPFHLSSMAQCFVISNVTYYVLNKITTPLGISLLVPIMLGVGLSYITSKFVKKLRKPLYRGMSKELFDETISKLLDKGSIKYKICYDYFVLKQSVMYLSLKYNYSDSGIKKIKDRVNKELEKLI